MGKRKWLNAQRRLGCVHVSDYIWERGCTQRKGGGGEGGWSRGGGEGWLGEE